jgi:hypothetical protein
MKWLDPALLERRIRVAIRQLPARASFLNIGCSAGALFRPADGRIRTGLIVGMALDEHCGCSVRAAVDVFKEAELMLMTHRRFQLGANNLLVFTKPPDSM